MDRKIVGVLAGVAILAVAGLLIFKPAAKDSTTKTNSPTDSSQSAQSQQSSQATEQASAATITYTDSGFSPSSIKVKSGDKITIKNTSSRLLDFASGPHPQHTDDTDLNAGVISSGQSQSFVVTKKGTFSFHNHLNDNHTGEITVE